jgi:hypothetical protein
VTRTSQEITDTSYEITDIAPNSPTARDERISRGLLLMKIDVSFGDLRDMDSVGKALQGTPATDVTLLLKAKLIAKTFPITLIRQQSLEGTLGTPVTPSLREPGGYLTLPVTLTRSLSEESRGGPGRTFSTASSAVSEQAFSFLENNSQSPDNPHYGNGPPSPIHKEPPETSQDHTDTLTVLRSMNKPLEGKPEGSYVSQKELAGLTYATIPGTIEEIKRRFIQEHDDRSSFTHFLKDRTHPTGKPLLEWKDGTPTEVRLTSVTPLASMPATKTVQTAPYASGSRPNTAATFPPPRNEDLRNSLRTQPKKPRSSEHIPPNISSPTTLEEITPLAKAALARIFNDLWENETPPDTAQPISLALERLMHLQEGTLREYHLPLAAWYNSLADLYEQRQTRGEPAPRPLELERWLTTQDEQIHRSRPFTPTIQLSTAHLQQAMIEVCHNPTAPHINTLAALRKEIEHHLQLPDNVLEERKGDIKNWFRLLQDLYMATHAVQTFNQQPYQSSLELWNTT